MLPTFICVGAAKAGTTTLNNYLDIHPEVGLSLFKEPDFFHNELGVYDGGKPDGPPSSGHYYRGFEWYKNLFRPTPEMKAIGEISTAYIAIQDAPQLIYNHLPNVQIIFCLRDPVARLYSHYWEERKAGRKSPPFDEMVRSNHPRFAYYYYVSSYHLHIKRYLELFPTEKVLITLFDDLRDNPLQYIQEVYNFIGVNHKFTPPNLGVKSNISQKPKSAVFQRLLTWLATARWELTTDYWLYEWMAIFGRWLVRLNSRNLTYPPLPPEIRRSLVYEFKETTKVVESLLQRELTSWKN